MIEAVVLDLDGVLVDSEPVWARVRRRYALDHGGRWSEGAETDMMGMSSTEWSRYMRDRLGVDRPPPRISDEVARLIAVEYDRRVPLVPGAVEVVERLAARWPLGLASSANRSLIDLVLERVGLAPRFSATVSSEEVARGKPAPDVYLEAARRLGVDAEDCAAVEDSANGIRSAAAAGLRVVAVPNPHYPPGDDALAQADVVLEKLVDLDPEALAPPG